jgi:hypothetical protein
MKVPETIDHQAISAAKITTTVKDKYPMLAFAMAVPTLRLGVLVALVEPKVIAVKLPESVCDEAWGGFTMPLGERTEMGDKPRPLHLAL